MREYFYDNMKLTYQDSVVWVGDSNIITIESSTLTDKVGGEIIIRHPNGTETRTIRHLSELPKLLFVLDDALIGLDDDNIGQYTVQVNAYKNGVVSFAKSFSFQLLKGKSFTNQSHAISRTIYIYDNTELNKMQVYSPSNGVLHIGNSLLTLTRGLNQYNMTSYIQSIGTYGFCLEDVPSQPVAVVSGDLAKTPTSSTLFWSEVRSGTVASDEKGGDVWKYEETIFPVCYTIVYEEACWNYDFVELRYRDTDGCIRYLGGRIGSEKNKVQGTMYERTDGTNVFRNIPYRYIGSTQRSLKICLQDIAKDAYPQDILYSDTVEMRMYNGEWWPVTIESDTIEIKNNTYLDIELNIIISRE